MIRNYIIMKFTDLYFYFVEWFVKYLNTLLRSNLVIMIYKYVLSVLSLLCVTQATIKNSDRGQCTTIAAAEVIKIKFDFYSYLTSISRMLEVL